MNKYASHLPHDQVSFGSKEILVPDVLFIKDYEDYR